MKRSFSIHYYVTGFFAFIVVPALVFLALTVIFDNNPQKSIHQHIEYSYALEQQLEYTQDNQKKITLLKTAYDHLLQAIEQHPYSSSLWLRLAQIEAQRGHEQKSKHAQDIALSLKPSIQSLLRAYKNREPL